MLMNWPERVWIYSPLRVFFQWREIKRWKSLVGLPEGGRCLEIGCGLGRGAHLLVKHMGFSEVLAFDLEHSLVKYANRATPMGRESSVSFFVGDAQDLPASDGVFDAVVNFGIIHHVLDWRRCIREIARVLKPGGIFYFEEIYPPLYANFISRHILRHPRNDRFYEGDFLNTLTDNGLMLLKGVKTGSRFGIVGAAQKKH